MKQILEIQVPNDYSAITLTKFLKLQKDLKVYGDDEEAKLATLFYHLCGVEPGVMTKIDTATFIKIKEQLLANGRDKNTVRDLISQIPHIYYKNIKGKIVVDKCRSWTIPANIDILEKYVDKNYKIIILERSVTDIVKSFVKL